MLVLFILISIGFLCGKKGIINDNAAKKMTDIVLYVVTPCVMISAFQKEFSADTLISVLIAAAAALIILVLSTVIARLIIRDKDVSRKKVLQFSVIF